MGSKQTLNKLEKGQKGVLKWDFSRSSYTENHELNFRARKFSFDQGLE